jgi:hypothetical protein
MWLRRRELREKIFSCCWKLLWEVVVVCVFGEENLEIKYAFM